MLWRLLLSLLLTAILVGVSVQFAIWRSPEILTPTLIYWKPTILWVVWAGALLWVQRVSQCGLLHFFWGKRLRLSPEFWKRNTFTLSLMAIGLAIANLIVAYAFLPQTWINFKLFAPILCVLLYVAVFPRKYAASRGDSIS